MNYSFPGNIRELENIIERGVAMENSNIILPENLVLEQNAAAGIQHYSVQIPDKGFSLDAELEKVEKTIIEKALEKAGGSKTKAAQFLGLRFDSLRYRMEKLKIK